MARHLHLDWPVRDRSAKGKLCDQIGGQCTALCMSWAATYAVRVALVVAHAGILRVGDVEGHHPPAEWIGAQSAAQPDVCTAHQEAWDRTSKRGRHSSKRVTGRFHTLSGLHGQLQCAARLSTDRDGNHSGVVLSGGVMTHDMGCTWPWHVFL